MHHQYWPDFGISQTATRKDDGSPSSTAPIISLGASVFLLTAAISFAVYARTASDSIAGGDSGELVAEGCQLGTSHPPGYPLYTIIVYFVTQIIGKAYFPSLTPAYLVNIASCLFGAVSAGLIALVVFKLTEDKDEAATDKQCQRLNIVARCSAAVSVGLIHAFSPLVWQYSTTAEVFSLHNFFVSFIVYVLIIYDCRPNSTTIITLGSFVCGLAMTNQHTSILLVVPVVAYVFYNSSVLTKPKLLLTSTLAFIAGMSLYALLPYFAINNPHAGSWGQVTTIPGFIHHFLRKDYGTLQLFSGDDSASEGVVARTLSWAVDFIFHQIGYSSTVILSLLGFAFGIDQCEAKQYKTKKHPKNKKQKDISNIQTYGSVPISVWKVILLALVFYLTVFHTLANLPLSNELLYGIHQRFWMHPNILAMILIGIGMHKSIMRASKMSPLRVYLLASLVLLLPYASYCQNYNMSDQSTNQFFRKYALAILEPLPEDSLVFINYDQTWTSIRYLQECEGVRKDVTSINLSMMTFQWNESKRGLYQGKINFPGTHYTKGNTLPWTEGGFTFSEFIDANVDNLSSHIFIAGQPNFEDPVYTEKYEEQPYGLVRQIQSKDSPLESAESYREESLRVWRYVVNNLSDLPNEEKYPQSTWEWTIRREFFDHLVSRSTYLLSLAIGDTSRSNTTLPALVESVAWLELASSWDEANFRGKPSMYKNKGLAYMNIVRSEDLSFPIVDDLFSGIEAKNGGELNGRTDRYGKTNWWTPESNDDNTWKDWATTRFIEEWKTFLSLEASKKEPDYNQIESIFNQVHGLSHARSNNRSY